jgi:hypothetical protein
MKPDWDSLSADYADSSKVVIAVVDGSAAGKPVREKYIETGTPTIIKYTRPDAAGEDYKGGRDLPALKKFIDTELGPGCSVDTLDNCSDAQKKELETYIAMDAAERESKLTDLKAALKKAEDDHNELLKNLQEQFKGS